MLFKLLCASLFVIAMASPAMAASDNATVFPPVTKDNLECGNDQLRVISWAKGALSTICLTGQEVLTLAIPSCAANQQVVYDGSKYICRSPTSIPTCTGSQYLSFNGSEYECKSNTPPPTCTASQVLTYNGSGYVCIERTDSIPVCSSGYFLTYNGTNYQCAKNQEVAIPECAADQVLKGIGGKLVCMKMDAASPNVGWVKLPAFTPCAGGSVVIQDDLSPEAICKSAGFTTYSGACKGNANKYGADVPMQGMIVSNRTGVAGCTVNGEAHWAIACIYGATVWDTDEKTEILCVK
jgi:hypothetical protein